MPIVERVCMRYEAEFDTTSQCRNSQTRQRETCGLKHLWRSRQPYRRHHVSGQQLGGAESFARTITTTALLVRLESSSALVEMIYRLLFQVTTRIRCDAELRKVIEVLRTELAVTLKDTTIGFVRACTSSRAAAKAVQGLH